MKFNKKAANWAAFFTLFNLPHSGLSSLAMGTMFILLVRQALHILHFICKFPLFNGCLQKATTISCKLAMMDFFRSVIYKITHSCFPPIKKSRKGPSSYRERSFRLCLRRYSPRHLTCYIQLLLINVPYCT